MTRNPVKERRTHWIQVRVTERELARWSAMARQRDTSVAELVRALLTAWETKGRINVDTRLKSR